MYAVEFETKITNGHIVVPEEFRNRLSGSVRVLVLLEGENGFLAASSKGTPFDENESEDDASEGRRPGESLLAYRLRNPYQVDNFRPLSREEVHERRAEYEP